MKKIVLLIIVSVISSCGYFRKEQVEINQKQYDEFIAKNEIENIMSTINLYSDPWVEQSSKQILEEEFGKLDKTKIKRLFDLNIQGLKKKDSISLGVTTAVFAQDTLKNRGRRCGTFDSSDSTAFKAFSNDRAMPIPTMLNRLYTIPIVFHVINSSNNAWTPSPGDLKNQIDILNNYFSPIQLKFKLSGTSQHINKTWSKAYRTLEGNKIYDTYFKDMIDSIPWDNPDAIHIYVNENKGVLGQASFPFSRDYQTKFDNVLISKKSFNNRIDPISNRTMLGKTLVHEIGHFFGLFHTFHSAIKSKSCEVSPYNGCSGQGDMVSDTPPQKYCHFDGCGECDGEFGCDNCSNHKTCDTCTFDNHHDDVKNLMGYNPDSCIDHFTPKQYIRMQKYFFRNRFNLVSETENLFDL